MVTFQQLIHAQALFQCKGFRKAAEKVNISQPAFSRSISNLEDVFGAKLFNRKRGDVTPTVFGEAFEKRCNLILAESYELKREINLLKKLDVGFLKLAFGHMAGEVSGFKAIGLLTANYPKLRSKINTTDWYSVEKSILKREVDIGFAEISEAEKNTNLQTEIVGEHQFVIYCRPEHPLAQRTKIQKKDIEPYPIVSSKIPIRFIPFLSGNYYVEPNSSYLSPTIETTGVINSKHIVMQSDALSISIPYQLEQELKSGQIKALPYIEPWMKTNYGFIYEKTRLLSPSSIVFMEYVREIEKQVNIKNNEIVKSMSLYQKLRVPNSN